MRRVRGSTVEAHTAHARSARFPDRIKGVSWCSAPVGLGQVDALASQVYLEQSDRLQVGLDRTVRLVLGPKMPLEGAGQVE